MSKSDPKKRTKDLAAVCLPFPYPVVNSNGSNRSVVWPLTEPGFPLFYGTFNAVDKCVQILDETAAVCLRNMGFFGINPSVRLNSRGLPQQQQQRRQQFKDKQQKSNDDVMDTSNKDTKKLPKETNYLNGKYVLVSTSLPNASTSFSSGDDNDCTDDKAIVVDDDEDEESFDSDSDVDDDNRCQSLSKSDNKDNVTKLSLIESFFISYVFGSLNVMNPDDDDNSDYLSLKQMWLKFANHYSTDPQEFAVHYSAYHYFRSKGWIVRNGSSFGVHYVLYKEGPHLYHALYSVIIQYTIDGNDSEDNRHSKAEPIDWFHMSALIRLQKNVRKQLLVCMITVPKDCDISAPNCIKQFEIDLLEFNRWNTFKKNQ
ncbi:uncharacterized protein LOC128954562 [Oppia nitens]|uniref:uncharacterized protein LOC128954562 n=1 Tax=Oppia nitens TaxID=1686743 RepID=UPI0023DB3512|nr:uncharacterized protein LOC128954562 [Oppia nitens]